jgi:hypothetical protein
VKRILIFSVLCPHNAIEQSVVLLNRNSERHFKKKTEFCPSLPHFWTDLDNKGKGNPLSGVVMEM